MFKDLLPADVILTAVPSGGCEGCVFSSGHATCAIPGSGLDISTTDELGELFSCANNIWVIKDA